MHEAADANREAGSSGDEPLPERATARLRRTLADEAQAQEARRRYTRRPMPAIDPDPAVAPLLLDCERLLGSHDVVTADITRGALGPDGTVAVTGRLYLTSHRLLVAGETLLACDLEDIEEAIVSGNRLLLVLRDGAGLSLGLDQPQVLRVEIAAARAESRERRTVETAGHIPGV